ncbi:MAG: arginine--tRNA ligase [Cellvibrionaceae bacterium]|nr:arginine--tRNA ligase [Cellvibrionaceae bacterium]
MNIRSLLTERFHKAMQTAGIDTRFLPNIAPNKQVGFGDYQVNGAMAAAKALKTKPRALAQTIIDHCDIDDIAEPLTVAGPGFINIHLKVSWLNTQLQQLQYKTAHNLPEQDRQTVVIDYSAPNLAKQMHVGHLRSTIIGDAMARILDYQGHKVIRQNHVGDWGTQFGMLLAELEEQEQQGQSAKLALQDLEIFYQQAKRHFDASEDFAQKARDCVVKLQSGDTDILALWETFKSISLAHNQAIYTQLNTTLNTQHVRGESSYNSDLSVLVDELTTQQLAVDDKGAKVVFLEELADKEGKPSPVIIQKQGGGFLYATTDLAALRYRSQTLQANRILYFIDARQSLHLRQVFTLARKAKFVDASISLEHHAFGTMMGTDGKPFKTRTGNTVKLAELLDEAVARAEQVVAEKNSELSETERKDIAHKVGIGAVKYADLSKTRTNDYIFNWDTMLSFEGNTAPYLQYAYARIQSIFRKADVAPSALTQMLALDHELEKRLAIKLLQLPEVLDNISKDAYPHLLCGYLYDLASLFMGFYEACPILKQGVTVETKNSRLQLCNITADTLKTGLGLLGIETLERM